MIDQNLILLQNINYKYEPDAKFELSDINLYINKGETFGLLGPSGAGKSTIQKLLTKLIQDFTGKIMIFGSDIRSFDRHYYENIGVSFELPNHYLKLTAVENLDYFTSLFSGSTLKVETVLDMVGLEDHAHLKVENFSKGMKNRLTLARSLLNNPDILFLDEPTAGLDPVNKDGIIDLIHQLQDDGKTIFLTTHDMYVVEQVCHRVGFINDGRIKKIGIPEELKNEYGSNTIQVEYLDNGTTNEIYFDLQGIGSNSQFQDVLQTYEIKSIHSQEATLAGVFIEITGRSLI